jgi:hypothetical protein
MSCIGQNILNLPQILFQSVRNNVLFQIRSSLKNTRNWQNSDVPNVSNELKISFLLAHTTLDTRLDIVENLPKGQDTVPVFDLGTFDAQ